MQQKLGHTILDTLGLAIQPIAKKKIHTIYIKMRKTPQVSQHFYSTVMKDQLVSKFLFRVFNFPKQRTKTVQLEVP